MTKPKPVVAIPANAKCGDVMVLRNRQRRTFSHRDSVNDIRALEGEVPSWWYPSGAHVSQCPESRSWDVVQFIRSTPPTPKPKRQDKDAAWLRKFVDDETSLLSELQERRINAICARLQKLADSGETK